MSLNKRLYCNTIGCKMAYAVKGIVRILKTRFDEEDIPLTIEQFFVLNILDNSERLILQELADIIDRDKSAVLRHLNGLEEQHFVARAKDPEDGRRKIILVTKKGVQILRRAIELEQEVNAELTNHLSEKQLKNHEQNIDRIYNNAVAIINS